MSDEKLFQVPHSVSSNGLAASPSSNDKRFKGSESSKKMLTLEQLHEKRATDAVRKALGDVATAYEYSNKLREDNDNNRLEKASIEAVVKYLTEVTKLVLAARKYMLDEYGSQDAKDILSPKDEVNSIPGVSSSTFNGGDELDPGKWSKVLESDNELKQNDFDLAA